jgi:hypothetical protein
MSTRFVLAMFLAFALTAPAVTAADRPDRTDRDKPDRAEPAKPDAAEPKRDPAEASKPDPKGNEQGTSYGQPFFNNSSRKQHLKNDKEEEERYRPATTPTPKKDGPSGKTGTDKAGAADKSGPSDRPKRDVTDRDKPDHRDKND